MLRKFVFITIVIFSSLSPSKERNAISKFVFIGDSLTEGYGVAQESAFPALLEKRLLAEHRDWQIINSGISGSTSASAPSRMRWALKSHPQLIFLALGANDALRGLKVTETEKNLAEALKLAKEAQVPVILAGIYAPPNYGKSYADAFKKIFTNLKLKFNVHLIPFLLKGVAGHPELNQSDGIHPNEMGHRIIADLVYESAKGFL